jgi:spore germination cell wall hydrolase CwlJ-like protein
MSSIQKWAITLFILLTIYTNIALNGNVNDLKNPISDEDIELLSKLINSESGTEDLLDKLMVGSVVLNRMRHSNQSMEDVIFKPNMFSGVNSASFKSNESSKLAALFLLLNGPIDTSVHYFLNPKISTNRVWVEKVMRRELVLKNDNHYFYK